MFQKPTFGSTTSGFGSFNATPSTSSPFGGFKPQATTSAFGAAPAFGASAAPQPAQTGSMVGMETLEVRRAVHTVVHYLRLLRGGVDNPAALSGVGLWAPARGGRPRRATCARPPALAPVVEVTTIRFFGAPAANTSGLFGSTAPAASSSFGAPASSGFGFGGGAGGGLFGGQAAGGGLFGTPQQQTTSAFGAKPAGFGFGSTPAAATASTGVFGAAAPAPSLFAPAQNTAMGGGGLFSNTAGAFGATTAARGTAHVKYNPVVGTDVMVKSGTSQNINIKHHCITCMKYTPAVGTDVMVKSGTSQNINIKHHCITCMKEYESKSLEELRLEDYLAGNKGAPAAAGVFGAAKPLFGGSRCLVQQGRARRRRRVRRRQAAVRGLQVFSTTRARPPPPACSAPPSRCSGAPYNKGAPAAAGVFGAAKPLFGGSSEVFSTTRARPPPPACSAPPSRCSGAPYNKGAPAAAGVFGAAKPLFGGSKAQSAAYYNTRSSTPRTGTSAHQPGEERVEIEEVKRIYSAGQPFLPAAFGQPATTAAQPTSVFGGGGFGQTTMGQNSTFAFGASTQPTNSSTNLFGANKPAFGATATPGTTGLFGAATTQAPAFGATNTSTSFGFGANTQNQSTGLFGAKPATTGFGAPAASGFGSFSSGGLFANKPATATAQPAPAFGAAAPAFGAPTSTAGSLFGNSAFGKPAQPSFGFGSQPTTGLGGGLGGGLGATSFQAKPGGGFPSLNTSAPSLFGGQANTTLNFNTETASRCYSGSFQAKPGGGFPSLNTSAPSLFGGQANTTLKFNTGECWETDYRSLESLAPSLFGARAKKQLIFIQKSNQNLCDLMKVINEQNTEKNYKIDEILKENGHIVLRLPPYHPELNPIELVWRFIIEVNENDDEDEDDDDDEQVQTESEHESDMEIDL
ncbi:unnamed protein product [Plutella xylostella]|uniref:Nuclear pore complex protein Nup98-Nup96 n=1 Tax=Plutella xylostella TaxID=51655 RepID=A0A8S4EX20_PLUXY|nr:unnamed protein product [Plutella xylostella]